MSGSAFEGGAVIEGEGQLTIRAGRDVIQQAAFHHRDQAHRQFSITYCQSKSMICKYIINGKRKLALDNYHLKW